MEIRFSKMSGAGNDFVVIDNRETLVKDGAKAARQLCDRHWGIGSDGLLLLEKSRKADFRMMYYNADGSYGGMCGNGGRCIARFAYENEIAPAEMAFEALEYIYSAKVSDDRVSLGMKDPRDISEDIVLPTDLGDVKGHYVDTGAPHVVIFDSDLERMGTFDTIDLALLGRSIRYHTRFQPAGTNVNLVQVTRDKVLRLRTYERGVEAETLACGTGSIAASAIAALRGFIDPPVDVTVRSGSTLTVDFELKKRSVLGVRLSGPAVVTFKGFVHVNT